MSELPREWIPAVVDFLKRESAVVRIVMAEVRGSAPRDAGAFMLVGRDGVVGTIGGGRLEWESVGAARELLREDAGAAAAPARFNRVVLGADLGQCCGGVVTVWLERFTRDNVSLLQAAREAALRGSAVLSSTVRGAEIERRLISGIGVDAVTDRLLRAPRARALPLLVRGTGGEVTFMERLDDEFPAVWLYGAGHVGQALARILMELPLRLTWLDSRVELFPASVAEGVRIRRDPDTLATVAEAPVGAYFLVMTHSHPLDYALCKAILKRNDFAWLGLIGSMSKAARFRSRLAREGMEAEAIGSLVCPIGIEGIESKWPAAIAVAVAAQVMREISAASVVGAERVAERDEGVSGAAVPREVRAEAACGAENCASCGSSAGRADAAPAGTCADAAGGKSSTVITS
jgi:xanthine dehydrogenase accessory factor